MQFREMDEDGMSEYDSDAIDKEKNARDLLESRAWCLGVISLESGQIAISYFELKQKLPYIPNTYTSTI